MDVCQELLARYPFGSVVKLEIPYICPVRVLLHSPVSVFHILMELSQEPLARYPFGSVAKLAKPLEFPVKALLNEKKV